MIEIAPIQPEQIADAKQVIYAVAWRIFAPEMNIEEFIADCADWLHDINDYREIYTEEKRGLLLVVLEDGKVIGTGGVQKRTEEQAELKRIWLLEQYHGQKIGFRMVSMLLDFARRQGYTSAYLETSAQQKQAIAFYKKVGFYDVPSPYDDIHEVSMELRL